MTTVPSSLAVWNCAVPSAPAQMETTSDSPGSTGLENLPDMDTKRAGSEPHTSCSSTLPVMPYVHRPCRIGRLKPPLAANDGSECSGLRSPDSRYSSACSVLVCCVTL